jgi:glycosyltransferase involved in cell wall biosynthesis
LEKGVHCLIAALPEIAARASDVQLLAIGDGVARESLQTMVAALGRGDLSTVVRALAEVSTAPQEQPWLMPVTRFWEQVDQADYLVHAADLADRVQFTGYLPHEAIAAVLPQAHLLVIPSLVKEAFPLVSVEALACGVLPVGTYHGGLVPVLDEIAAVLQLPEDLIRIAPQPETFVAELAEKVVGALEYLAAPGVRKQVARRCRALAVEKYDWDRVVDRLERVYVEVGRDTGSGQHGSGGRP